MIQEIELVFYRDRESGTPCLGMVDKKSGEVRNVVIEDIIAEAVTGDGPVPVLVTYDRKFSGINMDEAYKQSFKAQMARQTLLLEDASGHRGRILKKINSISFPYAIALDRDGEEIPMSYGIDGSCSTGKRSDRIVKTVLLSGDGAEVVLKNCEEEHKEGDFVDSSDFPEPFEE